MGRMGYKSDTKVLAILLSILGGALATALSGGLAAGFTVNNGAIGIFVGIALFAGLITLSNILEPKINGRFPQK